MKRRVTSIIPFRRRPGAVSIGLLLATLALAGVLAYHAQAAVRSHRATAESVLVDYASIAAWEFARLARAEAELLGYGETTNYAWTLGPLAVRGPIPGPDAFRDAFRRRSRGGVRPRDVRVYFSIDLANGRFTTWPAASSGDLHWVADSVSAYREINDECNFRLFTRSGAGPVDVVMWSIVPDRAGDPRAVFGLITGSNVLVPRLEEIMQRGALLPPTVARSQPNDSLLQIRVLTADSVPLYESADGDRAVYAASEHIDAVHGGFVVQAVVRPAAAASLVIGGLPRSRLPIVIGLLILTVGVGVATLHQMRREQQLSRLRDDFVSGVSHELRTPLAQIRMFGELLDEGRLRTVEERKRSASVINREARRLTHLVENILHFSRLRRATARLALEPTDLRQLVGETVEAFEPLAAARKVHLREEIIDRPVVQADRDALSQVLLNLLDNALKYGPTGQTVTLGVEVPNGRARLWVEDEGPGVPEGRREEIWEPYHRLDRDANTTVTGSGIGLAVVAELVQRHRGRVWVETGARRGARFVVEFADPVNRDGRPQGEGISTEAAV